MSPETLARPELQPLLREAKKERSEAGGNFRVDERRRGFAGPEPYDRGLAVRVSACGVEREGRRIIQVRDHDQKLIHRVNSAGVEVHPNDVRRSGCQRERPVRLSVMLINRSAPPATVTPVLVYEDVRAAVAWLESAFAFGERVRIGDGHRAQLRVGSDGAVVVADVGADRVAPSGGGVTHIVKVRVPDVDAAFARAHEAGARVVEELTTWEYGERSGVVEDIGGHRWELTQTVRDVAPEEWGGATIAPG